MATLSPTSRAAKQQALLQDESHDDGRARQPAIQVSDEALRQPSALSKQVSREAACLHIQELHLRNKDKRVKHVTHGSWGVGGDRWSPTSSVRSLGGRSMASSLGTFGGKHGARGSHQGGGDGENPADFGKGDTTGLLEFVEAPCVGAPKGCRGIAWVNDNWSQLKAMETPRTTPNVDATQVDTRVVTPVPRSAASRSGAAGTRPAHQRAMLAEEGDLVQEVGAHSEMAGTTTVRPSSTRSGRPPRPSYGGVEHAAQSASSAISGRAPAEKRRPATASVGEESECDGSGDGARRRAAQARPQPMRNLGLGASGSAPALGSPSAAAISVLKAAVVGSPKASEITDAGSPSFRQQQRATYGGPSRGGFSPQASICSSGGVGDRLTPVMHRSRSSSRTRMPPPGGRGRSAASRSAMVACR